MTTGETMKPAIARQKCSSSPLIFVSAARRVRLWLVVTAPPFLRRRKLANVLLFGLATGPEAQNGSNFRIKLSTSAAIPAPMIFAEPSYKMADAFFNRRSRFEAD